MTIQFKNGSDNYVEVDWDEIKSRLNNVPDGRLRVIYSHKGPVDWLRENKAFCEFIIPAKELTTDMLKIIYRDIESNRWSFFNTLYKQYSDFSEEGTILYFYFCYK